MLTARERAGQARRMPRSIVRWNDPDAPRARLLCIAHAGAGAARFRAWAPALSADVALWAVRLAGRESRAAEPPERDLDAVVAELTSGLGDDAREPLALFGHCSGAYVALALAHVLTDADAPPQQLFIAGQVAPEAAEPVAEEVDVAVEARALAEQQLGPAPLDDEDLAAMLVAAIEADLALVDDFAARMQGAPPLPVPITAVVGAQDPLPREQIAAWQLCTTASFTLYELPGEHLLDESWEQLAHLIGHTLKHAASPPNEGLLNHSTAS